MAIRLIQREMRITSYKVQQILNECSLFCMYSTQHGDNCCGGAATFGTRIRVISLDLMELGEPSDLQRSEALFQLFITLAKRKTSTCVCVCVNIDSGM